MKIIANDGISASGKAKLEDNGFTVITETIPQDQLIRGINEGGYSALLVRSATKARKELIDACPGLRLIGRGGVGMDNIDVAYAREKGLHVINTPAASSQSVAELAIGAMFSMARFIYDSDRNMPEHGIDDFARLKKKYSKGTELRGKTLGIIGFGGIGQELAKYALGVGMKVIFTTLGESVSSVTLDINGKALEIELDRVEMDAILSSSDYISIHVPKQSDGKPVIGAAELTKMKKGVSLVNTARGGVIDESALIKSLESGHVGVAFLDVFTNEPTPREDLLKHPKIISTPHIGGSTMEAQNRIGDELAEQIIKLLGHEERKSIKVNTLV